MLENTLERLETLVAELLQQNQALRDSHDQLQQQLRKATEENETLQLSMLEAGRKAERHPGPPGSPGRAPQRAATG